MDYRLEIVPVLDVVPIRFVMILAGGAYETVAGLSAHLDALPKGSTIVLDPGCLRMGGEPLIDDAAELKSFESACHAKGVALKIIPSG